MRISKLIIGVEDLDELTSTVKNVVDDSKKLPGMVYSDIRLKIEEGVGVYVSNGVVREVGQDFDVRFGVRAHAADGGIGQGYAGGMIGAKDIKDGNLGKILAEAVKAAYNSARAVGRFKVQIRKDYPILGQSIIDSGLAETPVLERVIPANFTEDPRLVDLESLCDRAKVLTEDMRKVDTDRVVLAGIGISSILYRQIFADMDGRFIDHSYPKTQASIVVRAVNGDDEPELMFVPMGNYSGLEVLDGANMYDQTVEQFALEVTGDVAELSTCPMLVGVQPNSKVVTNGAYNALWVHENVGHPSEADRALGMEAGYAGRTWFFRNLSDNQLGKQIADSRLNVYTRSDLDAYGKFEIDDEGTEAAKIYHIKEGRFIGFMHSRWTAYVMSMMGIKGQTPDGSMRATNGDDVPYVRMRQTGIEAGTDDPEEMLKRMGDGWLLEGKNIPSMGESRENFEIAGRRAFRIENGRRAQLYRGVTLTGDAKPYMMSIWAVGNDVELYNVPNCGKALPQQVMHLSNPAPSMGAVGTISGTKK